MRKLNDRLHDRPPPPSSVSVAGGVFSPHHSSGINASKCLTHVINYSLPEDPAVYLHRVGRTGRIGKTGTVISLLSRWQGRAAREAEGA